MLSRSNSQGSLDETKALLAEDDQTPKDGQLEIHVSSDSSGEGKAIEKKSKTEEEKND